MKNRGRQSLLVIIDERTMIDLEFFQMVYDIVLDIRSDNIKIQAARKLFLYSYKYEIFSKNHKSVKFYEPCC